MLPTCTTLTLLHVFGRANCQISAGVCLPFYSSPQISNICASLVSALVNIWGTWEASMDSVGQRWISIYTCGETQGLISPQTIHIRDSTPSFHLSAFPGFLSPPDSAHPLIPTSNGQNICHTESIHQILPATIELCSNPQYLGTQQHLDKFPCM
jgi:hypothetical protein